MSAIDARKGSPDPATVEVIRHYFVSAAAEMERTLVRSAYTTIIYEINDFGLSIFDADYNLLADSTGLPLFLGANAFALPKTFEKFPVGELEPGDVVMMNVPYWSGAHTNDGFLFSGAFLDGEIVGYVAARGHWTDMGGKDPGYILDSTTIHQEGVLVPGLKIFKRGEPNEDLLRLLRANSRAPETIMGDLNAQVAALRAGAARVSELFAKYGVETTKAAIGKILADGERQARTALADLPQGSWEAENWMDNDGVSDDLVRIHAKITIDDDGMTVDFSGSSPEVRGPINLSYGMALSASRIVFKTLTTPMEPTNAGQFVPLTVIAPEGNLFNAVYPAPVFTIWAGVVAIDTLYKVLAEAMPDIVPASSGGDLGDPGFYGKEPYTKRQVWHQTNAGVGWGARKGEDGLNTTHHISMSTVRNVPVEVIETRLPVMCDRVGMRRDSGGAGQWRGGLGTFRDYRFTGKFGALNIVKKTRTPGWGIAGGHAGPMNVSILMADTTRADWQEHWKNDITVYANNDAIWGNTDPSKVYCGMFRGEFGPGDVIRYLADGGGGWGDPLDRPHDRVLSDVTEGYVSREAAERDYGVVFIDDSTVDEPATLARRAALRSK